MSLMMSEINSAKFWQIQFEIASITDLPSSASPRAWMVVIAAQMETTKIMPLASQEAALTVLDQGRIRTDHMLRTLV